LLPARARTLFVFLPEIPAGKKNLKEEKRKSMYSPGRLGGYKQIPISLVGALNKRNSGRAGKKQREAYLITRGEKRRGN